MSWRRSESLITRIALIKLIGKVNEYYNFGQWKNVIQSQLDNQKNRNTDYG